MPNNRSKMHRTTTKGVKWLKSRGYLVDTIPHLRHKKDLFGIADAIAIKSGEVHFIQFKSNQAGNKRELSDFAEKNKVNVMLIVFKDRVKLPYIESWNPIERK